MRARCLVGEEGVLVGSVDFRGKVLPQHPDLSGDSPPLTSGKWDCSCATSYRDMEQSLNIKLYLISVILLKVNMVK